VPTLLGVGIRLSIEGKGNMYGRFVVRKTVLILLSGFLGAGKTTLMLSAADRLRSRGLTVACVTNDQGEQLVDSKMVLRKEIPLQQIQGGCFCCRFEELVQSVNDIVKSHRPDVILAEAVGSCTDLVATVIKPLQSYHGDRLDIRPLTTVVDPDRLSDFLSGASPFTEEIQYLFRKQLEEAQYVLLNKSDLLRKDDIDSLLDGMRDDFRAIETLAVSALNGAGLKEWLDVILSAPEPAKLHVLDIDYDIYAEGEAQLGWLNASLTARGEMKDVGQLCESFTESMLDGLKRAAAETAHLKLWAQDSDHSLKISAVRNQVAYSLDHVTTPSWSSNAVTIWVNARVNIGPAELSDIFHSAQQFIVRKYNLEVQTERVDCFSPSRPVPTYRIV
jgi:G3E family GTPase